MNGEVLVNIENFTGWAWMGFVVRGGNNLKYISSSSFNIFTCPNIDLVKVFVYGSFAGPVKHEIWEDVDTYKMRDNLFAVGEPFPGVKSKDLVRLGKSFKAVVWVYLEGRKTSVLSVRITIDS